MDHEVGGETPGQSGGTGERGGGGGPPAGGAPGDAVPLGAFVDFLCSAGPERMALARPAHALSYDFYAELAPVLRDAHGRGALAELERRSFETGDLRRDGTYPGAARAYARLASAAPHDWTDPARPGAPSRGDVAGVLLRLAVQRGADLRPLHELAPDVTPEEYERSVRTLRVRGVLEAALSDDADVVEGEPP